MRLIKILLKNLVSLLFAVILLAQSAVTPGNEYEQIRAYTRMVEFDYVNWTINALLIKNIQESIKAPEYMSVAEQRKVVFEYLRLLRWEDQTSAQVNQIYANPDVADPGQAASPLNKQLALIKGMEDRLKPLAEAVLQYQVSTTVAELGLGLGGQPIPPILYHATNLPYALIISPRNVIRQDADISLQPDLTIDQITQMENAVEKSQDVSALVVPVGGVGIYPTMVMSTTDLSWLLEVVSHEWTHNFLTLHPLGALYMSSGTMRTINETTANLSGKEISRAVMARYYPEMLPPEPALTPQGTPNAPTPTPTPENPNVFNFNKEMHTTRVQVDAMLQKEEIKAAEDYMEARRRFFWEHGYQIRKLNQAYFAFYGAYNDQPGGGAAGQDPVGPAVQQLRKQSKNLSAFLNRIAWVTSYPSLVSAIQKTR